MNDIISHRNGGRLSEEDLAKFNGRPYIVVGAIIAAALFIFAAVLIAVFS